VDAPERRDFVLHAPIARAIWSLAWPIMVSTELSMVTGAVLLFWLGHLIGSPGLIVESLFRPLNLLVGWFFMSGAVGASVLVSRSVGAGDGRGLSIAAGATTLSLALWAAVTIVIVPLSPWIADLLAGDLPVRAQLLHFMLGWFVVALPMLAIADVLLEVANATGATKFNLLRLALDLGFMIALTPLLMRVVGLGIVGSPVSDGIAALGLNVVMWLALVRHRTTMGLGELGAGAWRARWSLWKELLAIGVPVQLGRIATFVAQLILVQRVRLDGGPSVAGYGIAGLVMLFGAMLTLGLAQGGAILVGQALGAELHDRARSGVRATLVIGWIVIAVFIAATAFARPVIGLFTDDPAIARAAEHALALMRWAGLGIATWQVLLASFAAYRATARAGALLITGEVAGLVVAFAWPGSNLDGVCVAFIAANALKALLLLGLFAARRTSA
jgi:multidrug resistance protein, MATE family